MVERLQLLSGEVAEQISALQVPQLQALVIDRLLAAHMLASLRSAAGLDAGPYATSFIRDAAVRKLTDTFMMLTLGVRLWLALP
jgi:hypothetical protein